VAVGTLLACNMRLPSLSADTLAFAASTVFAISPALVSVIVLALLASRLQHWEALASRSLVWRRLALGVAAIGLAVGLLLPAAAAASYPEPELVAVQGVLACCGLGMIASRWLPYAGQAAVAFFYGLLSVNAAWAARGLVGDLLALGTPATPARLTVAGVVALVGLVVQATRSGRLT
jgi:hypothetical protein